ncbi:uncharacterized protein L969DRAFT_382603 [Mixia osmundae IAM 14324]|nr:uncharacterized protein L969DRAFT_382603 [Mixia osmundae IAM 14324]KEI39829.1 hypothetical protein L969DRAFT_382603 [Mixia osmundae IAM 14324]
MADTPVSLACADFDADALLQLLPANLSPSMPPQAILQRRSSTDSVKEIMTDEQIFALQLEGYFAALSPSKQGRTTVTQSDHGDIVAFLSGEDDQMRNIKFRSWALKNFKLSANGSRLVSTSNGLPIACVEQYHSICAAAHGKCMHGGRDKTHKAIAAKWAFIPKDIVARFVATCPLCRIKRPSMHESSPEVSSDRISSSTPDLGYFGSSESDDGEDSDCMIISPPPNSRRQSFDESIPDVWTAPHHQGYDLPADLLEPLEVLAEADAALEALERGRSALEDVPFALRVQFFSPDTFDNAFDTAFGNALNEAAQLDLPFDEQHWPGLKAEPSAMLCEPFAIDWTFS